MDFLPFILIIWSFRSSIDELQVHPFMKHPKKLSGDPHALADEMTKFFGSTRNEEKSSTGKPLERALVDGSSSTSNPLSLSWEF